MKSMRQMINLMEGVMAVPGVGVQPGETNGSESDMQTDGTAARNNSYAAFDSSQGLATESQGKTYQEELAEINAKAREIGMGAGQEAADRFYARAYANLLKQRPKDHENHVSAQNAEMWKNNDWQSLGGNRSPVDEKSTSEKQARFMAAAAHDPAFAKKTGMDQSVAKEFNQADTGTKQLSKAMKHKNERVMESPMDGDWDLKDLVAAYRSGKITNQEYESYLHAAAYPEEDDGYTDYSMRQGEMGNPDMRNDMASGEDEMMLGNRHDQGPGEYGGDMYEETEQQYSPEVQQALADFENVVMNLGMAPEDAYDRICQRLSDDGVNEFHAALEATGKFDDQDAQDADDFVTSQLDGGDTDDSYALASAGFGSDEDYGGSGDDDFPMDEDTLTELSRGTLTNYRNAALSQANQQGGIAKRMPGYNADKESQGVRNSNVVDPRAVTPGSDASAHAALSQKRFAGANKALNKGAQKIGQPRFEEAFDLNNGYHDINDASGNDYFPSGADSPAVKDTGPSGARQGDNPEQKKMQVDEVHKELVYGYRNFLKESEVLNELSKKTLRSYAKKSSEDADKKMWSGDKKAKSGDTKGALKDFDKMAKRNKGEIRALKKSGDIKKQTNLYLSH